MQQSIPRLTRLFGLLWCLTQLLGILANPDGSSTCSFTNSALSGSPHKVLSGDHGYAFTYDGTKNTLTLTGAGTITGFFIETSTNSGSAVGVFGAATTGSQSVTACGKADGYVTHTNPNPKSLPITWQWQASVGLAAGSPVTITAWIATTQSDFYAISNTFKITSTGTAAAAGAQNTDPYGFIGICFALMLTVEALLHLLKWYIGTRAGRR